MKLDHLNLSVSDVPQTARFFEEFFGFRRTEMKGRDVLAVLFNEAGFSLVLSSFDRKTQPGYPKDFHIGFTQENKGQVEAIHQRLKAAGVESKQPQAMHGSWGFYFHAPGAIMVEVSCPLPA
jgi:catechol 2,3-dioxygenase-like lactoylglutathione lyase family enzyme